MENDIENLEENKANPFLIIGAAVALVLVLIAIVLLFVGRTKKSGQNNNKPSGTVQNAPSEQTDNQTSEVTNEPAKVPSYLSKDSAVIISAFNYATKWQKDAIPWVIIYSVQYNSKGEVDPKTAIINFNFFSKSLREKTLGIILDQNGNLSKTDTEGKYLVENPQISDIPPQSASYLNYINLSDLKIDLPQALLIGEEYMRRNHPDAIYADGGCIISLSYLKEENSYFWSYASYSGETDMSIDHVFINAISGKISQ